MSELFTVKLPTGHEQRYSLDELDAAYKGGFIDERTLVLPSGAARWVTLAELAGLEEAEAASPPSIAPMAIDADVPVHGAPPARASVLSSTELPPGMRPRRTGRVFAIAVAAVAVIGIGVAATRGASAGANAFASLKSRIVSAEGPKAAAAMQAPRAEEPAKSDANANATPPPTLTTDKLPNAAPSALPNVPTMSAASLPDAPPPKKKAKARPRGVK